jgi:translation initiation factor 3 subunit C
VVRLSDEASLIELAESVIVYYKRVAELTTPSKRSSELTAAANVSLMIVEHLYYKHDTIAAAVQRAHLFNKAWGGKYSDLHPACIGKAAAAISVSNLKKNYGKESSVHPAAYLGNPTVQYPIDIDYAKKIEELAGFIYKHGEEKIKTRVLLCSVYHHALHDRYYQARDVFLISHIQDFIDKADVRTQILYNRSMAMLGLCAFRLGLFQKAHDCLSGVCGMKLKELLAQGQAKWVEKDVEQERVERRRQIPYHMHINPDLLECCHLTCAMILELPQLAKGVASGALSSNTVTSRIFRKYLLLYTKQVFTGPPENTREHVLAATKCLLAGDWLKACEYILSLEVWNLVPNDGGEIVKQMLQTKLKEEAVRTFLLINSEHYDSMSLPNICKMFSMDKITARRIICKMIYNKEISAAWDVPSDFLIIYKTDANLLQNLSRNVIEKVSYLLESNEKILDPLTGNYGHKENDYNTNNNNAQRGLRWSNNNDQQQQRNNKNRSVMWKSSQQYVNPKVTKSLSRATGQNKAAWGISGNRGGANRAGSATAAVNVSEQMQATASPQVPVQNNFSVTPRRWASINTEKD